MKIIKIKLYVYIKFRGKFGMKRHVIHVEEGIVNIYFKTRSIQTRLIRGYERFEIAKIWHKYHGWSMRDLPLPSELKILIVTFFV